VVNGENRLGGARVEQPARLESERLVLTPLDVDDAEEMVLVLADPDLCRFIGGDPPTFEGLRDRYRRLTVGGSADGRQAWRNWVVCTRQPRRAIGTLQATITAGGTYAEVAWVIAQAQWGQGYATEAATAVLDWLDQIRVERITTQIHPNNFPSVTVAERIGLLPTATGGEQSGGVHPGCAGTLAIHARVGREGSRPLDALVDGDLEVVVGLTHRARSGVAASTCGSTPSLWQRRRQRRAVGGRRRPRRALRMPGRP